MQELALSEDKYESSLIGVNSLNRMRMSATFGSSSEMIFEVKHNYLRQIFVHIL